MSLLNLMSLLEGLERGNRNETTSEPLISLLGRAQQCVQ